MKPKTYILFLLSFVLAGCVEDFVVSDHKAYEEESATRAEQKDKDVDGQVFYWYGIENRKIFLNQVKDKVFVKFAPNTTKEQFLSVGTGSSSLRSKESNPERYFIEGYSFNTTILEGDMIYSDIFSSLKAKKEIVSVTYLLDSNGSQSAYTDEFIVKLKDDTSFSQLQKLVGKYNCSIGKENEFVKNQFNLYVSKDSELDAIQISNLFYETGLFEFAEPNFVLLDAFHSNDTYYQYQWNLLKKYSYAVDINMEAAWTITTGSSNVRIAVIDSGVDLTHPDLQANLLIGATAGYSGIGEGAPIHDDDNHGTAVAGIIGAIQNNGEGISGVAPNCRIVPIKASDSNGNLQWICIADGINWAVNNNKAEVINLSLGALGSSSSTVTNAINNALWNGRGGKGCVVVASSGNHNSSTISYPATLVSTKKS